MSKKPLQYDKIVETALRGVVGTALRQVAEHGLPAGHALYITFHTGEADVDIPDHLVTRYPGEMTIVLQHQYWDLEVGETTFAVTLSFDKVRQRLVVPFAAVTAFADPAVQFGLKFEVGGKVDGELKPAEGQDRAADAMAPESSAVVDSPPDVGQVVNLDSFRKK